METLNKHTMLETKSFKTFKALLEEIENKFGKEEVGEAEFARKVLRDYGFKKNWRYALLPVTQQYNSLGRKYSPIVIIADEEGTKDAGMYSFDFNAPIDVEKSKLIMEWVEKNMKGELNFFTTNSFGDINDDAFADFNTHDQIWIRKHWINDY